jgi:CRISPR/Cas system CMR-associated protein Cmr1 (group 7 of RAMP superfamily)
MMETPRKKAEQLAKDFNGDLKFAMHCTEEILQALHDVGVRHGTGTRSFWYDVQVEIQNLKTEALNLTERDGPNYEADIDNEEW